MPELRPAGLIGSVERALGVLAAIAECGDGASAKAVAEHAHLPLPSVYRVLGTLQFHGYLTRHDTGGYGLGEQLASLYEHWCQRLDLHPAVRLTLRDVQRQAGVAAYYAHLRAERLILADVVDTPEAPRIRFRPELLGRPGDSVAVGASTLFRAPVFAVDGSLRGVLAASLPSAARPARHDEVRTALFQGTQTLTRLLP